MNVENNYGLDKFIDKMNEMHKSLAVNKAASVNANILNQQKIEMLKFKIKYEKNIIKKKQYQEELTQLLEDK